MSRLDTILEHDANTWRRAAACHGKDPRTFFEPSLRPIARRICNACPVRADCLEEAIADEREGYWGGATDDERHAIVEQRARAAARRRKTPAAAGSLFATLVALTAHPDRWAIVRAYPSPDSAAATASLLRSGQRQRPPGLWTFEGRGNDDGGSDLYARYDGPA